MHYTYILHDFGNINLLKIIFLKNKIYSHKNTIKRKPFVPYTSDHGAKTQQVNVHFFFG